MRFAAGPAGPWMNDVPALIDAQNERRQPFRSAKVAEETRDQCDRRSKIIVLATTETSTLSSGRRGADPGRRCAVRPALRDVAARRRNRENSCVGEHLRGPDGGASAAPSGSAHPGPRTDNRRVTGGDLDVPESSYTRLGWRR